MLTSLLRRGLLQSRLDCTLGKKRAGAGKREKLKRAGNTGEGKERKEAPAFSLFPSFPALPFSLSSAPASLFFLSLVFTNRSLCGGESMLTEGALICLRLTVDKSSRINLQLDITKPKGVRYIGVLFYTF